MWNRFELQKVEFVSENQSKRNQKFQLWGWILFIICAGFFMASGIVNGDTFSLIGSIVFLIACVVFIIPLIFKK